MRVVLSIFLVLYSLTSGFAQQGSNYNIELSSFDNYQEKKNIAFYSDHIEKLDNGGAAEYISNIYKIPKVLVNQDFIAVSAFVNYSYLEGNIELWYKLKDGKKWSSWNTIPIDEHSNGKVPTIYGLPAYISSTAKEIQFKLSAKASSQFKLSNLQFRFYFPGSAPVSGDKKKVKNEDKAINCSCPLPNMEYRDDWCPSGNCPKDLTPTATVVSHLIVHHSAGSNTSPNWAATVRSIWDYHVNTRGWDDIGYNFLIDPNGVIYEGRGNNVSGAHFSCMNNGTMGVCLLGDLNTASPTAAMINSLIELMGWKACDIDEDPRDTSYFANGAVDLVNICGHRDGNNIPASCTVTECPGNNMYAVLSNLRTSVYNYSQTCTLSPNYSDIVILNIGASMAPVENMPVDLEVSFKNIGDEDINENLNISHRINSNEVGTSSFSSIAINQSLSRSINYTFPSPGTYQYCAFIEGASNEFNVNNNSYCINLEVSAVPDTSTGISILSIPVLKIYPNPTDGTLMATGEKNYDEVIIYNTLGQVLLRQKDFPIDISFLAKGIYQLRLVGEETQKYKAIPIIKK